MQLCPGSEHCWVSQDFDLSTLTKYFVAWCLPDVIPKGLGWCAIVHWSQVLKNPPIAIHFVQRHFHNHLFMAHCTFIALLLKKTRHAGREVSPLWESTRDWVGGCRHHPEKTGRRLEGAIQCAGPGVSIAVCNVYYLVKWLGFSAC